MIDEIKKYIAEAEAFQATTLEEVEQFRIKVLGSKGLLKEYFAKFKSVPNEQKKEFGQTINAWKSAAENKVAELKESLQDNAASENQWGDLTRPSMPIELGSRHPISLVKNQIIEVFSRIGFNVHPARDMQDTFFIQTNPDVLLRTHTSSVQVRYMEENKPPIRTISPGRVFRNEDISARSHCIFHFPSSRRFIY